MPTTDAPSMPQPSSLDQFAREFAGSVAPPLGPIRQTIEELIAISDRHFEKRRNMTQAPPEFKRKLHELLVMVAVYRGQWPRSTWPFLELLEHFASSLAGWAEHRVLRHWGDSCEFPSLLFTDHPLGLLDAAELFGQDLELPPPRVIPFESIAELDALPNQTDESIAKTYGWIDRHGFADCQRVVRCREGLEPIPEPRVLPPKPDGLPMALPSLTFVYKLGRQRPSFD